MYDNLSRIAPLKVSATPSDVGASKQCSTVSRQRLSKLALVVAPDTRADRIAAVKALRVPLLALPLLATVLVPLPPRLLLPPVLLLLVLPPRLPLLPPLLVPALVAMIVAGAPALVFALQLHGLRRSRGCPLPVPMIAQVSPRSLPTAENVAPWDFLLGACLGISTT